MRHLTSLICLFCIVSSSVYSQVHLQNVPPVTNPIDWRSDYQLIDNWEFDAAADLTTWDIINAVRDYPADMGVYVLSDNEETVNVGLDDDNGNSIGVLEINTIRHDDKFNQDWVWQAWRDDRNCCRDLYPNQNNDGNGYLFDMTSGQVKSEEYYQYGYFEIRAKLPEGSRMWPAFWLFGQTNNVRGTDLDLPHRTEIDMFEIFPKQSQNNILQSNLHYSVIGENANGNEVEFLVDQNNIENGWSSLGFNDPNLDPDDLKPVVVDDIDFFNEYHTYGIEWEEDHMTWYFNNVPFLTIDDPQLMAQFNQPMRLIFNTEVDHRGADWDLILETIAPENSFLLDYVRIYKKRPSIVPDGGNCNSGTMSFSTDVSNGETFVWEVSDPSIATIANGGTAQTVEVFMNDGFENSKVNLTLTATRSIVIDDQAPFISTSSRTVRIPELSSDFEIQEVSCISNSLSVVAEGVANTTSAQWNLFSSDSENNIGGLVDDNSQWGLTCNFNSLNSGEWYALRRGVWDDCNEWSQTVKFFQADVTEFEHDDITCSVNGNRELSLTGLSSGFTHSWNVTNETDNVVSTNLYGKSVSFSNLEMGTSYTIKHGTYGGSCNLAWTERRKTVFVPSFDLNPEVKLAEINRSRLNTGDPKVALSFVASEQVGNHHWTLFEGSTFPFEPLENALVIGSAGTGVEFTSEELFHDTYYILRHGLYDDCALWDERRYLIRVPNSGLFASFRTSEEVSREVEIIDLDANLSLEERKEITANLRNDEFSQETISKLIISPNPAYDLVYIDLDNDLIEKIELYASTGGLIKTIEGSNVSSQYININDISKGVVFVKVFGHNSAETVKVVIK